MPATDPPGRGGETVKKAVKEDRKKKFAGASKLFSLNKMDKKSKAPIVESVVECAVNHAEEQEQNLKNPPEEQNLKNPPEEQSLKNPPEEQNLKNLPEEQTRAVNHAEEQKQNLKNPPEEQSLKNPPEGQNLKNPPEEQNRAVNYAKEQEQNLRNPPEEQTLKNPPEEQNLKNPPEERSPNTIGASENKGTGGTEKKPSSLDRAVEIVQKAINEDLKQNYAEAYKLYRHALDYFVLAHRYEMNEKSKRLIGIKFTEYLARAETLKDHLYKESSDVQREIKEQPAVLSGAIRSEKPNVDWDDVAGLQDAKALLKEAVVFPVKFPHLFTGARSRQTRILLYGPPGVGKSSLVKAVATAARSTVVSVNCNEVNEYHDEPGRLVMNLFELARKSQPAITFIDEIDSLNEESENFRRMRTDLLVQMDNPRRDGADDIIIAATSSPWKLYSIQRRFQRYIYVPLPEADARQRMFEMHIGKVPCRLKPQDFKTLAERTEGYSGSDISAILRDALAQPMRRIVNATHFRKIELSSDQAAAAAKDDDQQQHPQTPSKIKWTPCSPAAPGAQEMTLSDIGSDELLEPPVTFTDVMRSVQSWGPPTVTKAHIKKYEEWSGYHQ